MAQLQIVNVGLSIGDQPFQDVAIYPHIVIKRRDNGVVVKADDVPDYDALKSNNHGSGNEISDCALRCTWSRYGKVQQPLYCYYHPGKTAVIECAQCEKYHCPSYRGYFCSTECFLENWTNHDKVHKAYAQKNGYAAGRARTKAQEGWIEIAQGRSYTPTEYDIGYQMKLEVVLVATRSGQEIDKPHVVVINRVDPLPPVPSRRLVSLLPNKMQISDIPDSFTIMTYNLLAPYLLQGEAYSQVPAHALDFEYRKRLILRELAAYNPDILCLQEVQSDHWVTFWKESLDALGYDGQFKQKSGNGVYIQGGHVYDGCAIMFKRHKFKMVKSYPVEYDLAADSLAQQYPDRRMKVMTRLAKNNVALFAVLERLDRQLPGKSVLCVANTHIHANPDAPDVKVWQTSTLLSGVERIATSTRIPIVVAGDFNSIPNSAPYKLITQGRIAVNDPVHKSDPLGILKTQKISHQLQLQSVFASLKGAPANNDPDSGLWKLKSRMQHVGGEPAFSIISHDFTGTLDYIFYDTNLLQPIGLLEMPSKADCQHGNIPFMPNPRWPSDHLPIMAAFRANVPDQRNGSHQPQYQPGPTRYGHR